MFHPHNLPPSSCYVHRVRRVCNCLQNSLILPTTTDRTNSEMKFANKHWPKSQNDTTFIWITMMNVRECLCDRWCLAQRRYLRVAFLRLLIWSELGRSTEVHWRMRGVEGEKLPATVSNLTVHNLLASNHFYIAYKLSQQKNPQLETQNTHESLSQKNVTATKNWNLRQACTRLGGSFAFFVVQWRASPKSLFPPMHINVTPSVSLSL